MVFPSQANTIKTEILQALKDCTSPEKGIGYNKLFDIVRGKVGGSRRTFHKYLNELVNAGAVKKDKDPRHKAGVIIYRTEAATQEEVLIELAERITAMTKTPSVIERFIGHGGESASDEQSKIQKLVVLSDILGRRLASILPLSKPGWYAYAKIIKDGPIEKVTIRATSDDERNGMKSEYTIGTGVPPERLAIASILEEETEQG